MPLRSSSSPADIGLSKSEYEEAVNLEKLYFLVNKNDRCAICGRGGVAGVDVSRYEFLCASCSSGKSSFKRIGEDRFTSFEVNKLCARFDRNFSQRGSRRGQSRSPPPRGNSGRAGREGRRASRRQPSPVYAESESDDDEEQSPPPPRRSHSMPRGGDSSDRYKHQRHHQRHGADPFDNFDGGSSGWGEPMMSQAGNPRATGGAGSMGMMGNCSTAAAGMLGLGMQQQPGLAGMMGGGGGLGGGSGMMGTGLLQQQQPWAGAGGAGVTGLQQQQFLQQQLLQQQQLLALRQQQAAATAGRALGTGMLSATTNTQTGLPVGGGGAAVGMMGLSLQRPQAFLTAGGAGMLAQQQMHSPYFSLHQPQYPMTSPSPAPSNPFLSMQQPALGGNAGAAVNFTSPQPTPAAAFLQQQHLLQQPAGMRPLGGPAATGIGEQQSSNPFSSLGAAQRPPTSVLTNVARHGGAGAAGAAPGGGNVFNTSLW